MTVDEVIALLNEQANGVACQHLPELKQMWIDAAEAVQKQRNRLIDILREHAFNEGNFY